MTKDRTETVPLTLDMREQFIISKALCVAMEALKNEIHPPVSDISSMMLLMEEKFPIYSVVQKASEATTEQLNQLQEAMEDSEL